MLEKKVMDIADMDIDMGEADMSIDDSVLVDPDIVSDPWECDILIVVF